MIVILPLPALPELSQSESRARAAFGPTERAFHGGIFPVLRRPAAPIVEVVDERKYLFWRSLDDTRTLNASVSGFVVATARNRRDQGKDDDENFLESLTPPCGFEARWLNPIRFTRVLYSTPFSSSIPIFDSR